MLAAASSQWVGQGRRRRILFYFVNWYRNKLIIKNIDYNLVFYTTSQLDHPKTIKLRSPHAPCRLHLMSHLFPVEPDCFWLIVPFYLCLVAAYGHGVFLFLFFPLFNSRQSGGAAVSICVAGINLHTNQQRWQQRQRADGYGGGGVGNVAIK